MTTAAHHDGSACLLAANVLSINIPRTLVPEYSFLVDAQGAQFSSTCRIYGAPCSLECILNRSVCGPVAHSTPFPKWRSFTACPNSSPRATRARDGVCSQINGSIHYLSKLFHCKHSDPAVAMAFIGNYSCCRRCWIIIWSEYVR
jgi:hypothetical protein